VHTVEVDYEYDPIKNLRNKLKHTVDFEEIAFFEWNTAIIMPDLRFDYGEKRFTAVGLIKNRLYVAVYTERLARIRLISLRKANDKERKKYHEKRN